MILDFCCVKVNEKCPRSGFLSFIFIHVLVHSSASDRFCENPRVLFQMPEAKEFVVKISRLVQVQLSQIFCIFEPIYFAGHFLRLDSQIFLAPFKFLDNFQFLRKFWSCVSSVYWRKMRRKPQEQTLQYLSHGLTNPKFKTTFANRHSGVPGVEVVSEFRVGQVP